MALATVKLADSGQEFSLEEAIAGDDELLKGALRSVAPEIGDPQIKRENQDGQMVVTILKQAGRKGADTLAEDAIKDAQFGLLADGQQPLWMAAEMTDDAMKEPLFFDYSTLGDDLREEVQRHARSIKLRAKRTVHDTVQIGNSLLRVKERLPHGQFLSWLETELNLGEDSAGRFMQIAKKYSGSPALERYTTSALYLLAAPSTPESARADAQARAEAGEQVSTVAAREIVTTHKLLQQQADRTGEEHVLRQGERSFTFQPDEDGPPKSRGNGGSASDPSAAAEDTVAPAAPPPPLPAPTSARASAPATTTPSAQVNKPSTPAAQSPTPARTAPAAPALAPSPPVPVMPPDYDHATVQMSLTLFPEGRDPRGRLVLVSARVEGQRVFTSTVYWADLLPVPPVMSGLLDEVQQQLDAARALASAMKGASGAPTTSAAQAADGARTVAQSDREEGEEEA